MRRCPGAAYADKDARYRPGTTSTRAILFGERLNIIAVERQEFPQYYPQPGWVEHDPEDLRNSTIAVVKGVLAKTRSRKVKGWHDTVARVL